MKLKYVTVLIGTFALCLSAQSYAHLKEAIEHAKKKHADVATTHTEEAMKDMRESIGQ
jgi:Small metal-binding protein